MEDILYKNSASDVRIREMVETIPGKEKELPNQIILTIQSEGEGVGTPIFNKEPSEIGTKFILDDKEITSDDFQTVIKQQYGYSFRFSGLQFEDSDVHTLKVSLINSTVPNLQRISGGASGYVANSITSIIISNSITEIGMSAFESCSSLTSVEIPESVTSINQTAFSCCSSLTSIISLATTAPAIHLSTFMNVKTNGTLHVPAGSNYSAWMSANNYYLGKYSWTKVEDA